MNTVQQHIRHRKTNNIEQMKPDTEGSTCYSSLTPAFGSQDSACPWGKAVMRREHEEGFQEAANVLVFDLGSGVQFQNSANCTFIPTNICIIRYTSIKSFIEDTTYDNKKTSKYLTTNLTKAAQKLYKDFLNLKFLLLKKKK